MIWRNQREYFNSLPTGPNGSNATEFSVSCNSFIAKVQLAVCDSITGLRECNNGICARLVQQSLQRHLRADVYHRYRRRLRQTQLPHHVQPVRNERALAVERPPSLRLRGFRLLQGLRLAVAARPLPLPIRPDGLPRLRGLRLRCGHRFNPSKLPSLHLARLPSHPSLLPLQLRALHAPPGRHQGRADPLPRESLRLPGALLARLPVFPLFCFNKSVFPGNTRELPTPSRFPGGRFSVPPSTLRSRPTRESSPSPRWPAPSSPTPSPGAKTAGFSSSPTRVFSPRRTLG